MSEGRIRAERPEAGVGLIVIDRPDKRNAMSQPMIEDFMAAFRDLDADDCIDAIVLTGAGDKAFCAGHDLKGIPDDELGHLYEEAHMQAFLAPEQTGKPVIAAVNGAAFAGGFCLALHSDLRLATPAATFGVPGARLGIVPIAGQSARLVHLLPPAVVNEMVMCGATLSAERAAHFGFVNAVVDPGALTERAVEMAAKIAAQSGFAVQSYKRIYRKSLYDNVGAADAMEYWLAMAAGQGEDVREGLAAFRERREPRFSAAARRDD